MSNQIKSLDTFTLTMIAGTLSPADSTTYYFGPGRILPSTTDTAHNFNLGIAFRIIGAVISVAQNSTQGSTENVTLQLRNVTQNSSTSIGTYKTDATSTTAVNTTFTGLNIPVAAGDFICARFDTPVYAINPVGMIQNLQFICLRS